MREEAKGQRERRAERMHWWRQVLDQPTGDHETAFDEALWGRFGFGELASGTSLGVQGPRHAGFGRG